MTIVTIHKAKTELSKLLKRVEAGEVITIARGGKPIAILTGLTPEERVTIRMDMLKSEQEI